MWTHKTQGNISWWQICGVFVECEITIQICALFFPPSFPDLLNQDLLNNRHCYCSRFVTASCNAECQNELRWTRRMQTVWWRYFSLWACWLKVKKSISQFVSKPSHSCSLTGFWPAADLISPNLKVTYSIDVTTDVSISSHGSHLGGKYTTKFQTYHEMFNFFPAP